MEFPIEFKVYAKLAAFKKATKIIGIKKVLEARNDLKEMTLVNPIAPQFLKKKGRSLPTGESIPVVLITLGLLSQYLNYFDYCRFIDYCLET